MSEELDRLPADIQRKRVLPTELAAECCGQTAWNWRKLRADGKLPPAIKIGWQASWLAHRRLDRLARPAAESVTMTGAPISPETGLYLLLATPIVWGLLALFGRANREGQQ